jgi:hypothetical protein
MFCNKSFEETPVFTSDFECKTLSEVLPDWIGYDLEGDCRCIEQGFFEMASFSHLHIL